MAVIALATCSAGPDSASGGSEGRPPTTSPSSDDAAAQEASSGPGVIIDTDFSLWWDDATAIGMANILERRGEIRLLGLVTDVPNASAVAAIDAINTTYGNADIPLGAMAGSANDTFPHGYTDELISRLPHSVEHSDDVPEAIALYRRLLAAEADHSVTIVAIGSYTNLARLLDSQPDNASDLDGRELIATKVERLVIMDGLFPAGGAALTNQEIDPEAAHAVVTGDWPTPIAWVDGFAGIQTIVGETLCADAPSEHPMRIVYEELFSCAPPGDGNWDAPTLLYAIDDLESTFEELGRGGAAVINTSGGLSWQPSSSRSNDVYVHVADQQALNQRIEELLVAD